MSKFKVGDRVRRVRESSWPNDYGSVGKEYDVISVEGFSGNIVVIAGKGAAAADAFEPVAVAPATATLTIEAGKFYKTRDGRKVGPLIVQDDDEFPFLDDAACESYRHDGTWGFNQKIESRNDLIAEWVDGPDAYAPCAFEFVPFPQVGDAVLIPGVISAINQSPRGTNYNIVFETQNRRMSLHFLEEDFILDEGGDDEGGYPCANDNGPVRTGDTAKAFDALANSIFGLTVRRAA